MAMEEIGAMIRPQRIQRKRTKGWRMPPDTIYVGRPTIWGNKFKSEQARDAGYKNTRAMAVYAFRQFMRGDPIFCQGPADHEARRRILERVGELRGKNVACWCALDQPCHADVLLEIANQ